MSDGMIFLRCNRINELIDTFDALYGPNWMKENAQAMRQAGSLAIQEGRKLAAELVSRAYFGSQGKWQREIRIKKSHYSSGFELRMYGGRGVSLMNFSPSPKIPGKKPPEGVTAHVRRAGRRHPWTSDNGGSKSFIGTKNQGGYGVFVSHGVKKVIKGPGKRKPTVIKHIIHELEMLYGPSPMQAMQNPQRQEEVQERIEDVFIKELKENINLMMDSHFRR